MYGDWFSVFILDIRACGSKLMYDSFGTLKGDLAPGKYPSS